MSGTISSSGPSDGSARTSEDNRAPLVLLQAGTTVDFDVNDVDGAIAMLDRDFAGTVPVIFSGPVDPGVPGSVLVEGITADYRLTSYTAAGHEVGILGIVVAGLVDEPGREFLVHVEGFASRGGVQMLPARFTIATRPQTPPSAALEADDALAQRIAEEGIILLRNSNDVLPLHHQPLNILGSGLANFRVGVVGAGKINPYRTVRLREAIEEHHGFTLNRELADFHRRHGDAIPSPDILDRAKSTSDLGIVVISRLSGENIDNLSGPGSFELSHAEADLLRVTTDTFARTVVILNTPYPIDLRVVESLGVDAVLLAGVGGMLAGPAVVNVLDGTVNPSGRLSDTWARTLADIPADRNFYEGTRGGAVHTGESNAWIDTVYEEGIYVGYRYFSTFDADVMFPFGHGLSYTTFQTEQVSIETDDDIHIRVRVSNIGERTGREVVQLYVSKPDGTPEQPSIELLDFAKTPPIDPGKSVDVDFVIARRTLFTYDDSAGRYSLVPGEYVLRLGDSADKTQEIGHFVVTDEMSTRPVAHRLLPQQKITTLSRHDSTSWPDGEHSGVQAGRESFEPARDVRQTGLNDEPASSAADRVRTFADVQKEPAIVAEYVATLTVEQLARITVCAQPTWGMEGTGVAGVLAQPADLDLPVFQVADGNSGVNVKEPNVGFPTTVVLASTFDKELAFEMGRVLGERARSLGVDVLLAPALNLHRHPLNGRHPEYFSEDPYLSGVMAGHFAKGLESTGVGACYKHFAANNTEAARKRNQSLVPERALRDLYLKAFEVALSIHHPKTVMTAYNAINGRATSTDPELLDGVLRQDFDFTGMVMTDWESYATADVVDMIAGGNNWITPGSIDDQFTAPILAAIQDGRLDETRLRHSVTQLLRVVAEITSHHAAR
jgi:beta-glucosidase